MNQSYRTIIKMRRRCMLLTAATCAAAVLMAFALRLFVFVDASTPIAQISVILGFFAGAELVAFFRIIRYAKVLKNDAVLEAMEIAEQDEMNRFISYKVCAVCFRMFILILAISAIISAFFNQLVFITLSIALIVLLVLYFIIRLFLIKRL